MAMPRDKYILANDGYNRYLRRRARLFMAAVLMVLMTLGMMVFLIP